MTSILLVVESDKDKAEIEAVTRDQGLLVEWDRSNTLAEQEEFFGGLELLAIGGAALAIGKFITTEIDRFRGGVRINLSASGDSMVKRDHELPYGYVLIYGEGERAQLLIADQPRDWMDRFFATVASSLAAKPSELVEAAFAMGLPKEHSV